jgi:hypothetical protein
MFGDGLHAIVIPTQNNFYIDSSSSKYVLASITMYRTVSTAGRAALRRMPQRLPRNVRAMTPHHRAFHGDGSVPQYSFTPAEEVLLDVTAWFVAFALCWSPAHKFDDLEDQDTDTISTRSSQGKRERENNIKDRKQPKKDDGRSHPDPSI